MTTIEHPEADRLERELSPLRSRRAGRFLLRFSSTLAFIVVAIWPVIRRLRHPTFFGDDVTRLVDLIRLPLGELIFLPFAEHVAPLFQVVSWLMWQAIRHDIRLAPLGFTVVTVLPWLLTLALLTVWLVRETGSRTASFLAVAFVAQSPLIMEAAWWYSASSFLWAVAGILTALLGASWLAQKPKRALALVAIGAAIAPAGTSLGLLAAPLAILRGLLEPGTRRRTKVLVVVAAIAGILAYDRFCMLGRTDVINAARFQHADKIDVPLGLTYAFSVPGRLLWPVAFGVPIVWAGAPAPLRYGLVVGGLAFLGTAAIAAWPRARWNRRFAIVGAAMIYMTYALIYPKRVGVLALGKWTERQLLYEFTGRYHVLPLLGVAAILAAVLASRPLIKWCDRRPWRPALAGAVLGLVMLAVQFQYTNPWIWMLSQPGQKQTLAVLHGLGRLARDEGIPRSQLKRIIAPAFRSWNQNLVFDRPAAFSLMNLVTLAPEEVAVPLDDTEARARLRARLTERQRIALGSECCSSLIPTTLDPGARILAIARPDGMVQARELRPGHYRAEGMPSRIRFEFDRAPDARYLVLPGLDTDQDVLILWCDDTGRWRNGQSVRWLKAKKPGSAAIIDLESLIHQPNYPLSRIAIQFTRPGELALAGSPRLLK